MQASRKMTGLSGMRFDLSSAEWPVVEVVVPSEKTVAEEAGSERFADFAEGILCIVAVVAKPGSFAAVLDLNSL